MAILLPQVDRSGFGADFGRAIGTGASQGILKGMKTRELDESIKRLTGEDVSGLPEEYKQMYLKAAEKRKESDKFASAFQRAEQIYSDESLPEENKIFEMYRELSDHPEVANKLINSLTKPKKAQETAVDAEQFAAGYKSILDDDKKELNKILNDSKTSLNVKKSLTDLENKNQVRKDVASRERRSRVEFIEKSYQHAMNNERAKLSKNKYEQKPEERKAIEDQIKRLQKLQKKDLATLAKDPDKFYNLSLWNEFDTGEVFPKEEQQEPAVAKVKFDLNNPEHVARAKQVKQEFGGDMKAANKKLAEEFTK